VLYLSGCVRDDLPAGMGVMLTPMMGNRVPNDRMWAADTGCFNQPGKHDDAAYLRWLEDRVSAVGRCLFATAPDVVGDGWGTLRRSYDVLPRIRDCGFDAALVGQDGMTPEMLPWDTFDALFVGGTTSWKLSEAAVTLIRAAKAHGKWVHVGRVNSEERVMHFRRLGEGLVDSVDGTYIAFGPDRNAPRVASWMKRAAMQTVLW
jgi:hypothetical protein